MVILGTRAAGKREGELTLVVVVILVAQVPIQTTVQADCDSGFRRLEAHRIGRDQRASENGRECA